MTHEYDKGFEDDPGRLLDLAGAIADRKSSEGMLFHTFLNERVPMTELLPAPIMRSMSIGMTAWTLERLENPNTLINARDLLAKLIDDAILREAMISYGMDPTPEAMADTRAELYAEADYTQDRSPDQGDDRKEFKATIEAAGLIASLHGAEPTEVFRRDDLYAELMRDTHTPEEMAAKELERIELLERQIPDPELLARYVQACREVAVFKLKRYWGPDVLSDLPVQTMAALLGIQNR